MSLSRSETDKCVDLTLASFAMDRIFKISGFLFLFAATGCCGLRHQQACQQRSPVLVYPIVSFPQEQQIVCYQPSIVASYSTQEAAFDQTPLGYKPVAKMTPWGIVREYVKTTGSNSVSIGSQIYKGPPIPIAGIAEEKLKSEQLLIALTESVNMHAGLTLDRQCIEKGAVVVYCTEPSKYIYQVEAVRVGDTVTLSVTTTALQPSVTTVDVEHAGKLLFDLVQPELAQRLGVKP